MRRDDLFALDVRRHYTFISLGARLHDRGGSWFTSADVSSRNRVVIIGPTVVQELFNGSDPVGQSIQINGSNFTVVGVTASKGTNGTSDEDDIAMAPITAVQDTLSGYGSISSITVQATSEETAQRRAGRGHRHARAATADDRV